MIRKLFAVLTLVAVSAGAQTIKPEAIRAHMRFLADDLLEGRGTGARGYMLAAAYVAAQYQAMGLEPGSGGSYMQTVPFRQSVAQPESSIVLQRDDASQNLKFAVDFMTPGDPLREDTVAEGRVVFAGYGITAPEQHYYDDYERIDVRGKIVVIMSGAPNDWPSSVRAHHGASLTKLENAAAHGAIGVLTFYSPYDEKSFAWPRVVRQYRLGGMHWLDSAGQPHSAPREILAAATLSHDGAKTLFSGSRKTLEEVQKGGVKPFDLAVIARIHVVSKHKPVESPNVVGILRGVDPKLKDEYVVYSAHLDHLGISEPVDGDTINNGALDNASGIATILEVARTFAAAKPRPRRSILFLATTGEEKGLRGADYFANHPSVPLESLVADINIDEILMLVPTKDIAQLGAEHSSLEAVVERAAKKVGTTVSGDPYPEEGDFVRSDQYPFVKRGVPSVYIGTGYHAKDPKDDAMAAQMNWVRTIYHSPKDDMSQTFVYSEAVKVGQVGYEVGREVANAPDRPIWNEGDFFGDRFHRK
ncbi:MAG: peptidase [Acidobacteria bacterium]|nr:peptidase [Acidobacteriota bacterium]